MLDTALIAQLKQYLANLREPIELVATLRDDAASASTRELLTTIAAQHAMVSARFDGTAARAPSFVTQRASDPRAAVTFAGLPMGHEFTSLVLALLWAGGHPPKVDPALIEQARTIEGTHDFEVFFSQSCHNCPDVVQAATLLAIFNPNINATLIDGGTFRDEVEERDIMAVPATFRNGESFYNGKLELVDLLARLDTDAEAKAAAALAEKDPFDVLIVGGGPAGAAAAIYTARKAFRTGIAAERFGGQVADTLGIENFISVSYTEGPKLVSALESHVHDYGVDVMTRVAAQRLIPATILGGLHHVEMAGGATLSAKAIILATGARWRQLGVPGEEQYRNKGVAYCPHCDGPLFKGKRVAVVGGGNSGVEAAIDLAQVVAHVTLIEFDTQLRADEVLQRKLRSMANVTIITSAQTTEISGDGTRVNGLAYTDRQSGEGRHVALEGVFIQIGLVPNTEWLKDSGVALSRFGEVLIDHHGATNIPGVFAAGDCTTVPFKQIVIAMGEGSKAALSAFDYIIRSDQPAEVAVAA